MVLSAKTLPYKLIQKVQHFYDSMTSQKALSLGLKALKFIMFHMFAQAIGLSFFAYYTLILYEYDVVLSNGKIYEQESVFLSIILIQIFFRYVGSKIG